MVVLWSMSNKIRASVRDLEFTKFCREQLVVRMQYVRQLLLKILGSSRNFVVWFSIADSASYSCKSYDFIFFGRLQERRNIVSCWSRSFPGIGIYFTYKATRCRSRGLMLKRFSRPSLIQTPYLWMLFIWVKKLLRMYASKSTSWLIIQLVHINKSLVLSKILTESEWKVI